MLTTLLLATALTSARPLLLDENGYGPFRIGATEAELERSLHEQLPPPADTEEANCRIVTVPSAPHLELMIEAGRLARIDADESVANIHGVRIGDSVRSVIKRFPAAQVLPHFYVPGGKYVILKSSDGRRAFVFEAESAKVTRIRVGLLPPVRYVEGCL